MRDVDLVRDFRDQGTNAGIKIAGTTECAFGVTWKRPTVSLVSAGRIAASGQLGLNDLRKAFDVVSSVPASVMGLGSDWGIREGARADLLIGDAASIEDLVAGGAMRRQVMVRGRVVAITRDGKR
jgi:cytosine/adenosine deaminase-related metal-dependent hydrolase